MIIKPSPLEKLFDISIQNRRILYKLLTGMAKEELLKIPPGFRNNIWWNIAHVLVTEQLLIYKRSGLNCSVPESLVEKFRKGTIPDGLIKEEEIELVKKLLISTVECTRNDYQKGVFKNFDEYTTSANVTLKSVEDAIAFNVFHEGLHLGAILSLRKSL